MNRNNYFYIVIALAVIAIGGIYFLKNRTAKPLYRLLYYGPDSATSRTHTILPFQFQNQDNKTLGLKDFKGKLFVVDFFFTTCHSICPIMSTELERVDSAFKNNPAFAILSHTVDPEIDSVQILKKYAQLHNASVRWQFVTGKKTELYQQALKSYLIATPQEVTGAEDDFVHSQNLVLVDDELHIRGFYDGTNKQEVDKLISDIKILFDEKQYRENNSK
jgi:protein SCO1